MAQTLHSDLVEVEAGRFVGARVARKEDPRFLTGRGRYTDDVAVPGMVHAAFVRSPHARASVRGIDVADAARSPGVLAVYTLDDLAPAADPDTLDAGPLGARPLARGVVCFVGDPLVLVVAETRALAEDACELVNVDYEPRPPVLDLWAAVDNPSERVHPELDSNVARTTTSPDDPGLAVAFDGAAHVVTETIRQHRYIAVPMETRGALASWDPARGEMTVWISSQGAHSARDHFAHILGLATNKVHVIVPDVGGAFGQKINVGREETALSLAARVLARPVKWSEDRYENLVAAPHSRAEEAEVSIALDADATIVAMQVEHIDDVGAYSTGGGGASILRFLPGPYKVGKMGGSSTSVITNTSRRGAYRGPWMMETVAREIMLDIAARRARVDPLELRRRNIVRQDDLPYRTTTGATFDRITPAETLEQAVAMLDYDAFRREQAGARAEGRCLGVGIAVYVEPTAGGFGVGITESATIRIDPSGAVQVMSGVNSQGHSMETIIAQVTAEYLGVDVDDVEVLFGDTATAPVGATTGGSRNAVFGGGAARQAALEMRERIVQIAAHMLEASADDLDVEDGVVSVRGTPAARKTLAEIAELAYLRPRELPDGVPPGLEIASRFTTEGPTWSNAAHVCTCEVDPHTGLVTLLRYIVSEDCGALINPSVVEGQIAGGVVQGIGGVLLEHFVYDRDGNPTTTTFLDYLLPTASDVAVMEYGHLQTPSARPGGFKGMGEGGAIGAPAAVFNAVADAVAHLGAVLTDQPLTPASVLRAIREAEARAAS
ncbi:MAG TPA: xanthine dehydrogenase family protein molybdopterin-binding subunit [Acidimicrobiia bacterium]|nr:xanthine dehydrogenase family protein molybdopterin-binding subunit [Acidimicrobiia bacterium]